MFNYKDAACAVLAAVGAWVAQIYGGWTGAMTTLLIAVVADFISGIACGWAGKSPHTENGRLSSKVMREGMIQKVFIFVVLLLAARLDMIMNVTIWKDAACIYYIAEEGLSILENAGALGLPVPQKLRDAIEALKSDTEN